MTEDIRAVTGLGFSISRMEPDEHEDFPCHFHKLDEERDPFPCPETPYVFVAQNGAIGSLAYCKRHFALFASDMAEAIGLLVPDDEGLPPEPKLMVKDGSALTYPAFIEAFMDAKERVNGRNA